MANSYANTMAFTALVLFLVEEKGYSKEQALAEAKEKIEVENKCKMERKVAK